MLEGLMIQVMINGELEQMPYHCPRCDGWLDDAMMAQMWSQHLDIFAYACPKCGYFVHQRGRLYPRSLM